MCLLWKELGLPSRVDLLLCICVLLLLVLPITHLNFADNDTRENRALAKVPLFWQTDGKLNAQFGNGLDAWISDRVFLRHRFLQVYDWVDRIIIGRQNETNSAILGKDDWIFYKGDNSIKLYQNWVPFTDTELATIHKNLMQQKNWLSSKDIPYVVFIAPNKSDIYGDYYPTGIHKTASRDRVTVLTDYLREMQETVPVVFPLEGLLEHKQDGLLYYKNDTHWTPLGGYWGYRCLMTEVQSIFSDIEILSLEDMNIEKEIKETGDLNAMLPSVGTVPYEEVSYSNPVLRNGSRYSVTIEDFQGGIEPKDEARIRTVNPYGKYKAVIFRDSFCRAMIPYLSESFHEVLYVWVANHNLDSYTNIIIREKPDIVIHEMISRYAGALLLEYPHWSLEGEEAH